MKKLLLFFVGVLLSISLYSQSGATCATAKTFINNDTCFGNDTLYSTEKWFGFIADNTFQFIESRLASYSVDHVHKIVVYSGTCTSLVAMDSVNITPTNDSILFINVTSLTIGDTYFIKLLKLPICTTKCTSAAAIFDLCLRPLPKLDFIPDNDTIYAGNTLNFSNISTGFAISQSFTWVFGDICIDTAFVGPISGIPCIDSTIGQSTGTSHFYSNLSSVIVILSASDITGSYSATKTIYVLPPPPAVNDCGAINCEMVCNGQVEIFNWCPTSGNLASGMVQCWSNTFNSAGGFSATTDYWLTNNTCVPSFYVNDKVPNNFFGCQGDQNTGNAVLGLCTYSTIYANYREYATSPLCIPMVGGQQYNVSYWVSLGDVCEKATQAPRAFFTASAPIQPSGGTTIVAPGTNLTSTVPFGIITNDIGWTHITAVYTANGGEQQITLGNFSDDAFTPNGTATTNFCGPYSAMSTTNRKTAYYYIDSISVTPVVNPLALTASNLQICVGELDTLLATGGGGYTWLEGIDTIVGATTGTLYVSPDSTTTYTVISFNPIIGCFQSQSVTIIVDTLPLITVTSDTICIGQSATLTASGATTYFWLSTATSGSSITVSPIVTTTYYVFGNLGGCVGAGNGTVVVNNPTLSPVPTPIAVCNGASISGSSFTSSPTGGTFAWTNNNTLIGLGASGSGNVPAFTATNSSFSPITATITVTVTDSTGCAGSPVSYTITVNPTPNVNVPASFPICNGFPTSAGMFTSAVTGTTYSWTNSNTTIGLGASGTGNVPSFFGTNSTTSPISGVITVTPSANGCSGASVTYTITINPTPIISVSPPSTTIAAGTSVVLTASGGTTYLWSTGSTSNSLIVTPAFTTTYTVTGTNSFGCTSTTTVTITVVPPACLTPLHYDVPAGSSVTSAFPGFTTGLSGKAIRIDGPFTIDVANFSFSACNIIMMSNAKIIVPANSTFQLTNKTHMLSCTDMWDGIYVLGGGILLVNSNTIIEDGIKAINIASGGVATVTESVFNRNYTSIELTLNTGATSPLNINNCVFTSRNIPTTANPLGNPVTSIVKSNVFSLTPTWISITMKPPYSSFKSINGINSTDVSNLTIGSASLPFNGFENIGCGIRLTNGALSTTSNTTIRNNRFQNMVNAAGCFPFPCPSLLGIGISASGTATGDNRILIGGNLTGEGNQFRNTFTAVDINNYKQGRVQNNTITNTTTIPTTSTFGFGRIGIIIRPSLNNTLRVANNSVTNCANGIWINRSLNGINTTSILVEDNDVNANSGGYCSNGIAVTDVVNTGSTTTIDKIKIRNNSVTQAFNCVTITNVKNGLIIYQNPTLVVRNDGINLGNGIRLQNCKLVRVHNNPNITMSPLTSPVTSTSINYKGIQVITSTESWVSCNKIFNMGEHMTFVQNCSNSSVFDNQMSGGNFGLVLRNNGDMGPQLTSTIPSANAWGGSFSFHTLTNLSPTANAASKLYVNSIIPPGFTGTPTLNLGIGSPPYSIAGGGINLISNTNLPIACASIAIFLAPAPGGDPSAAQLVSMVEDQNLYSVYEQSTRFLRKKFAFEKLDEDGGTIAATDSVLWNFYDSTKFASLGKLNYVDKAIFVNDFVQAETDNSSVTVNNIIEDNQKSFNDLYLLLLNSNTYEYTASEKSDLYNIALQCPFEGGNAVWQARVLIWTIENNLFEFPDNCNPEPRNMSTMNNIAVKKSSDYSIYPNPNTGRMEVVYSLKSQEEGFFEIFEVTGKRIALYQLYANKQKQIIENDKLSPGVYLYSIRIDGVVVKTDKLIIVR